MTEKIIRVEEINPSIFFSTSKNYLKLFRKRFPKLKLTSRGDEIKVSGPLSEIEAFEEKLAIVIRQIKQYSNTTDDEIAVLLETEIEPTKDTGEYTSEVLVHGVKGKVIKPRTENQKALVRAVEKNDIVFAIGPAGTGKTYTGVAMAVRALKKKEVRKIILARPAVEAGESLGFLPGDLKEKIDPYLRPLYDALLDMIPADKYAKYLDNGTVEVIPLAFMRGRTLDNCFVILDEAQNATETQLKMFMTRMGPNAKMMITGDLSQIDLPRNQQSGLGGAVWMLKKIKGISVVYLDVMDVVRHKLVKEIIKAYDSHKPTEK